MSTPQENHQLDSKEVFTSTANEPTPVTSKDEPNPVDYVEPVTEPEEKKPWWNSFLVMGSATQIVTAAVIAIAIGLAVSTQVDTVPEAATEIISIPGDLWLRALKAVVLPLIVCAMILAVQRLREMGQGSGAKLAGWTVGYYVLTTLLSIAMSCIMTALVWGPMFTVVSDDTLDVSDSQKESADEKASAGEDNPPHMVVKQMFQSFIPSNIVNALASDELLSVLITACIIGYLIKDKNSLFLKLIIEIEQMIMKVITALIKMAPIGVFFLVLSNLMKLSISEIGQNLGMLIGGTLGTMAVHVFIILPVIFFAFTRRNPFTFWIKISPAWITAWGSASSAATLPVTLRCANERGIPITVYKFTCPLGCLINMDGTAIYFPMGVVFLAATQGHELLPTDYVIISLLATLASIGTTPIPSASLVLIVMICHSVGVEVTGMFAVIVAIDWLLDRFRTAINVSGDLFGSAVITKLTGIKDEDGMVDESIHPRGQPDDVEQRA